MTGTDNEARVPLDDFVTYLRGLPKGTYIVQGREARGPNEIEHEEAVRRAAAAIAVPPARTLRIHGHSDDLMQIENALPAFDEPGEITAACDPDMALVKIEVPTAPKPTGLYVVAQYNPADLLACWSIGIAQLDENVPLPGWPMRFGNLRYSTVLDIDIPKGAVVRQAYPNDQ